MKRFPRQYLVQTGEWCSAEAARWDARAGPWFLGVICSSPAAEFIPVGSGLHQRQVLCNLIPPPALPDPCQGSDLERIFLSQGTSRHPDEEIQLREMFQTGHWIFPNTPWAGPVLMVRLFQEAEIYFWRLGCLVRILMASMKIVSNLQPY